jgi:hypothetical protein
MRSISDIATRTEPLPSFNLSARLVTANRVVHHHPGDALSVLFLLGRVELVRFQVHCDRVHGVLDAKVFEPPVVVGLPMSPSFSGMTFPCPARREPS